jgi:hypothetical protein
VFIRTISSENNELVIGIIEGCRCRVYLMELRAFCPLFFRIFIFYYLRGDFAMASRPLRNIRARFQYTLGHLFYLAKSPNAYLKKHISPSLSNSYYPYTLYVSHPSPNTFSQVQNQSNISYTLFANAL